ncbi:efflux RND transporter periplasmic adaptor subunit [Tahibacter harae]|uniref:HlyD family efflux transporter periplasmic adaptor subunit n=1 Tax=Tahibacter harae TaxID=2963937 RepID=A0ABT1QM39_9GAMM|nr:HlyD family efflux transporter periplasmic adaptor subunit [Tahibacter harae]MCQ4163492.1 HlyD family efflux transporter periplasmic adaptor subunit [Tahibacter harae]
MAAGRPSRSRALYVWGGLVLLALVLWAAWPRAAAVDVGEVRREALEVGFHEEGRTRLRQRHSIAAPLDGLLDRVELEPGDAVEEGSVVATLRPQAGALLDAATRESLQAQLRAAEDALRRAEEEFAAAKTQRDQASRTSARLSTLGKSGQVSAQSGEEARTVLDIAQARLRGAVAGVREARHRKEALAAPLGWEGRNTAIPAAMALPAPVAGVVIRRAIESAGPVRAGQVIVEIGDPSQLEVIVELLTADALRLTPGAPVRLSAADGAGTVQGTLRRIEPSGFTKVSAVGVEEQRVLAIVDFGDAPAGWGDGYRVDARFGVWRAEAVLTVPISALFREADAWRVYLVKNGRAVLRAVDIGWLGEVRAEIRGGLDAGDRVVLYPGDEIRDGDRVQPVWHEPGHE